MLTSGNPRHLKRAPVTDALMLGLRRAMGFRNSSEPTDSPGATVLRNGALRINDVQYGSKYPNSYLDIYIADNDPTVPRPTFLYVHGGGFVLGDKVSGDPAAKGVEGFSIVSDPLLAAGFNLVSIDYALAPEFKYPVPLIQLSQAVAFLQAHGAEHGIDMSELIVGGGSAGGQALEEVRIISELDRYAVLVEATVESSFDSSQTVCAELLEAAKAQVSVSGLKVVK